jgi:hypothetical protein
MSSLWEHTSLFSRYGSFEGHPNFKEVVKSIDRGSDEGGSVTGLVSTNSLSNMPGNEIVDHDKVDSIANDLDNGRGLNNPIVVSYHPGRNQAYVSEGNHRVKAAQMAGITHLPTMVMRANEGESPRENAKVMPHAQTPYRDHEGSDYWPTYMHPQMIFHPSELKGHANLTPPTEEEKDWSNVPTGLTSEDGKKSAEIVKTIKPASDALTSAAYELSDATWGLEDNLDNWEDKDAVSDVKSSIGKIQNNPIHWLHEVHNNIAENTKDLKPHEAMCESCAREDYRARHLCDEQVRHPETGKIAECACGCSR